MDSTDIVRAFNNRWKPEVPVFKDRVDAGIKLGQQLIREYGESLLDCIVLGCPRGGLVVAEQVANELCCPLDMIVCRKISHPYNKEMGVGAIGEDGEVCFVSSIIQKFQVDMFSREMQKNISKEWKELNERVRFYRGDKNRPTLKNKTVVIVDDGMASGATVEAALKTVSKDKPKRIIIAQPVSSLKSVTDFVVRTNFNPFDVCINFYANPAPGQFWDIDDSFRDFSEVSHFTVCRIFWSKNPRYLSCNFKAFEDEPERGLKNSCLENTHAYPVQNKVA